MRISIQDKLLYLLIISCLLTFSVAYILFDHERTDLIRTKDDGIRKISAFSINQSQEALSRLGEQIITEKAKSIARQAEIYIDSNPDKTLKQLQDDPYFRDIVLQPVGESGYTFAYDYDTMVNAFHSKKEFEGMNYYSLRNRSTSWWAITSPTINGEAEVGGYYLWEDPDGVVREKYKYTAIVRKRTSDGVGLAIGASAYMTEFLGPSTDIGTRIKVIELDTDFRTAEFLKDYKKADILASIVLLTTVIVLSVKMTHSILLQPINDLMKAVESFKSGNLEGRIDLNGDDELGLLGRAFNDMAQRIRKDQDELKASKENLEKQVNERTKDLNSKVTELEKVQRLTMDRELKMIELKKKLKRYEGGK